MDREVRVGARSPHTLSRSAGYAHHPQQVVLMQSHHISDFSKTCLSDADSNLAVRRLQRLATAVARISLRQRMQLVFEGYRARFAQIGAVTAGTRL